jgi:hypothetical protein
MTFGFFRARILTHFRAAALGFEPRLPGSLAIVSGKRYSLGKTCISPFSSSEPSAFFLSDLGETRIEGQPWALPLLLAR